MEAGPPTAAPVQASARGVSPSKWIPPSYATRGRRGWAARVAKTSTVRLQSVKSLGPIRGRPGRRGRGRTRISASPRQACAVRSVLRQAA